MLESHDPASLAPVKVHNSARIGTRDRVFVTRVTKRSLDVGTRTPAICRGPPKDQPSTAEDHKCELLVGSSGLKPPASPPAKQGAAQCLHGCVFRYSALA